VSTGVDEHGRPISPDGFYVWDGTQWAQRVQVQPQPARHLSPDGRYEWNGRQWVPIAQAAPAAPAQQGIDLEAEGSSYPLTHRNLKKALRELPTWLQPGEPVLATCPGGSYAVSMSTSQFITTGHGTPPGVIAVATDRRIVIAGYTGFGGSINDATDVAYGDLEQWKREKRGFVAYVRGWGQPLMVSHAVKSKLPGFFAVVEPRLRVG
jgi:hypothetical protein